MAVDEPVRTGRIEQPLEVAPNMTLSEEELQWGQYCHFAGVFGIIGTLICWLMKKDTSKWIDEQGKQAVNFHITNAIIAMVCGITIIGILLLPFVGAYSLIFSILAGMKVKDGVPYQYPFSFNLVK